MARLWIDGQVGVHGQLVVYWRDSRIVESRFPISDLDVYAAEVDMFRRDKKVKAVERHVDGVVVERFEGVH